MRECIKAGIKSVFFKENLFIFKSVKDAGISLFIKDSAYR